MFKHDSPVNFFLFYAANFFFTAAYYMLFPGILTYVHGQMAGVLGIIPIIVTYFLAIIIFAPLIGYFVDWIGRLRFAIIGVLVSALCILSYSIFNSLAALLILRLLHGVGTAAFNVAMLTTLTDATDSAWRGEIVASYLIPQLFWTALGAALSLFILPFGGAKTIFVFAAIMTVIAFVFTAFANRPKLFALSKQNINIAEFIEFENIFVLCLLFAFFATYSALLTNIDKYAPNDSGGFLTWFVIAGMIILYNAGGLSDQIGRAYTALLGFVFLLLSLGVLIFAKVSGFYIFAGLLFGIAYGLVLPALTSWWMDIIPLNKRGLSMGAFQSVQGLGMLVGLWLLNTFALFSLKAILVAALILNASMVYILAKNKWPDFLAFIKGSKISKG